MFCINADVSINAERDFHKFVVVYSCVFTTSHTDATIFVAISTSSIKTIAQNA